MAYHLKDDLNALCDQPDKRAAGRCLDQWLEAADISSIRLLQKFAKTLAMHDVCLRRVSHPPTGSLAFGGQ